MSGSIDLRSVQPRGALLGLVRHGTDTAETAASHDAVTHAQRALLNLGASRVGPEQIASETAEAGNRREQPTREREKRATEWGQISAWRFAATQALRRLSHNACSCYPLLGGCRLAAGHRTRSVAKVPLFSSKVDS